MADGESSRKLLLVLGVGALLAWALFLGLHSSAEKGQGPRGADRQALRPQGLSPPPEDLQRSSVGRVAMQFTDAYLGYEVGGLTRPERRTLSHLCTRQLAGQLLKERPRAPAAGAAPREWAARIESVHVGFFGGHPALLAGVLVVGVNGAHVLTPTFVHAGGRWLVAGIGA